MTKAFIKKSIFSIATSLIVVLAHVAVILAMVFAWRYYGIYPEIFRNIAIIVACIIIIIDIIYFIGFGHKDLALKIIALVLAFFILLGGTVGTYFIGKANGIVDNVLNTDDDQYETFSGVFAYYDQNKEGKKYKDLKDLTGQTVGMLTETSNGIYHIAKGILNESKIDYAVIEYKTNAELVQALLDGDVDVMVITSAYKQIYSLERDENSPFAEYLDHFVDFYSYEQDIKVKDSSKVKNITTEPFNVLLIGYSRTEIGSPIGLADSIILATINPQTYTVSMMSIARDSFVPIPCYGGEYDKINSPRSTSRQAFIETVENFIGMDIDYYMELDYLGLVAIVNAIGGILINNPVEFELDGIYVPAGEGVFADGQMALQFCRERHHMPNGDFDRQQHQKEVIISIAEKFIQSGDINLALHAMEEAADFMSTDLSLNQLTTIFNLLLNTKNYTSLDTFDLVDFQTLRITGYGGLMYYSYSMHLPLWVYLIYQGSYDESMEHVNDILGKHSSIKQNYNFSFSIRDEYERPALYSTSYPNKFLYEPEPMPAYWATLVGMTVQEAQDWAKEKGVRLSISYINVGDEGYDETMEGRVSSQSVRYGSLVSENPSGSITVMGIKDIDESKAVPQFVGHSYSKAINWAKKYNVNYSIDFDSSVEGKVGDVVSQTPAAGTSIDKVEKLKLVVKAGTYSIRFDKNGHGKDSEVPKGIDVTTGDKATTFASMSNDGDYVFTGWYTKQSGGDRVKDTSEVAGSDGTTVYLYAHWSQLFTVTFVDRGNSTTLYTTDSFPGNPYREGYIFDGWFDDPDNGSRYTSFDGITSSTTLYAHWSECTEHSWGEETVAADPTCTGTGYKVHKCTKCGKTEECGDIPPLGHNFADGYCTRCGEPDPNYIPPSPPEGGGGQEPQEGGGE